MPVNTYNPCVGSASHIHGSGSWSNSHNNTTDVGNNTDVRARVRNVSGYEIYRALMAFLTNDLIGKSVISARLGLYVTSIGNGLATKQIDIVNNGDGDPTNNTGDDYSKLGTTLIASAQDTDLTLNNYYYFTIPVGYIVTNDYSKFGLRDEYDRADSSPPGGENDWAFDTMSGAHPPILEVTWTTGGALIAML